MVRLCAFAWNHRYGCSKASREVWGRRRNANWMKQVLLMMLTWLRRRHRRRGLDSWWSSHEKLLAYPGGRRGGSGGGERGRVGLNPRNRGYLGCTCHGDGRDDVGDCLLHLHVSNKSFTVHSSMSTRAYQSIPGHCLGLEHPRRVTGKSCLTLQDRREPA